MREVEIISSTGVLSASVFDNDESEVVLVIASATGVRQSFYTKFAQFVSSRNVTVITFDYCGIGLSLKEPIKELTHSVSDWGTEDLNSILNYSIEHFPTHKKVLLGHSIGGQLVGLSVLSLKMDKVILVAAQSGFWKLWKGIEKIKMWTNWYVLFPFLINVFGYLPSKRISGMENLPKGVAKQWMNWGRNSNYLLGEIPSEQTVFDKLDMDLTAFSIDDDQFAPKRAVEWMTARFSRAKLKSVHLEPQDYGSTKIGHFGIFKDKFKDTLWQLLLNEIK
ncbi:MAG: alpha/beta fold hydrolase [Flavobacteriales bacterium]